jgi:hypothetical protein
MSLDTFIPTIWSARLLQNLQNALVYGQAGVINRDYEDAGQPVDVKAAVAAVLKEYPQLKAPPV